MNKGIKQHRVTRILGGISKLVRTSESEVDGQISEHMKNQYQEEVRSGERVGGFTKGAIFDEVHLERSSEVLKISKFYNPLKDSIYNVEGQI